MPGADTEATGIRREAETDLVFAGFFRRFLAFVIDYFMLLLFLAFPIMSVLPSVLHLPDTGGGDLEALFGNALILLFSFPYCTLLESSRAQSTPGKAMMSLKVVNAQGGRINFWQANARFWSKLISAVPFGLGFLSISNNPRRQGWHDVTAKRLSCAVE